MCNHNCESCTKECTDDEENIVLTSEEYRLSNELDNTIRRERVLAGVDLTVYIHHRVDKPDYIRAKSRLYHENFKKKHPERVLQMGRANYHNHKKARLQRNHEYYSENKQEILEQKQGYYTRNRDKILAPRKENYDPHPREVIDTPEAELKRQREKARYERNKEEINRKRREKRKKETK